MYAVGQSIFCDECNNWMPRDRVDPETGKEWYVCITKNCSQYRIAKALTGEESGASIQEVSK